MPREENDQADVRSGVAPPILADDDFYRALSARPRRRVLWYLLDHGRTTVAELADVLCGWRAENRETVTQSDHRRIRAVLDHQHLPVLADASLVSYDRDAGDVAVRDLSGPVRRLIRRSVRAEGTDGPTVDPA